MRTIFKILIGFFLLFFILNSYAIRVSIQTSSSGVYAVGFSVAGQRHGSLGSYYNNNNVPIGAYMFGMRVGGLLGNDIHCTLNGSQIVRVSKDTTAVVNYNGKTCKLRLYPSKQ